jgi:NAD(P)-dependent dehydrogenase (short-subunit alcohol dehydrogenase family)
LPARTDLDSPLPDLSGRHAVVTGANSGLGLHIAEALLATGADVTMTSRDAQRGETARDALLERSPGGELRLRSLDLASLESVRRFTGGLLDEGRPLDILVNNAGVMAVPERLETVDGFELQFGTNHLGPFALTGLLMPALRASLSSRVVSTASIAARRGRITLDRMRGQGPYEAWPVYSMTKLANLVFARELQARSDSGGWGITSIAAHPGFSTTNLTSNGPRLGKKPVPAWALRLALLVGQSASDGARPSLYAAAAPDALPGGYYGPNGRHELRGGTAEAEVPAGALESGVGELLWRESERLTGVVYPTT